MDAEVAEWIAGFDEGALAGEVVLCLLGLGDLAAAERAAERVIELRDGDRVRSRAFGQLTLARVHRQLTGLGTALHPYRDATEVAGFLGQLVTLPATARKEPVWPV